MQQTSIASLVLRVGLSAMMLTHGWPKLIRLLEGNFQFADPLGLGSEMSLVLAVFAEFLCSILLIIGFKTRLVTIPLVITMLVAAFIIHLDDPWKKMEFPLLYAVGYLAILLLGSGRYSLDGFLKTRR